jgi:hypothetical protein
MSLCITALNIGSLRTLGIKGFRVTEFYLIVMLHRYHEGTMLSGTVLSGIPWPYLMLHIAAFS